MSTDEADRKMLQEVHAAIVGNEAIGHKGIAARLDAVEKQSASHDRKLLIAGGAITGINLVVGWIKLRVFGGGS